VFPTYWVILAFTLVVAFLSKGLLFPVGDVVWSVTLLPTWEEPIVGIAWTLQHEISFYLIFAILIFNKRGGLVTLVAWFVAIAVFCFAGLHGALPKVFSSYNIEFFFGMGVAAWLRRGSVVHPAAFLWSGLVVFAISAVAEDFSWLDGYGDLARLAYGVPSAAIILGIVELERSRRLAVSPFLLVFGKASYSIYLFHLTGIGLCYKILGVLGIGGTVSPWGSFIAIVAAGLGLGVLVSRMVEYPVMRGLRRRRPMAAVSAE
jgi:peptidoglycan/LPS O-acetylase OafA/YrhL